MMLDNGRHGRTRIPSRPSVELMTTDCLTPAQMTQRLGFPLFSAPYLDFWTSTYQTIDD
jgi:hypothetical protein